MEKFDKHVSYMRNLVFVRERKYRIIVYNKGSGDEKGSTNEVIKQKLRLKDGDKVIELENFGREGATYLKVSGMRLLLQLQNTIDAKIFLSRTSILFSITIPLSNQLSQTKD